MKIETINVAKDFSRYPGGRVLTDGPHSGEHFRNEVLLPVISQHRSVELELDGTRGYGSSFLEEAFGGLVRIEGYTPEEILQAFNFVTSDESLVMEITSYIKDASS